MQLLNKMEKRHNEAGEVIYEDIDANAVSKGLDMGYKIKGTYSPIKIDATARTLDDPEADEQSKSFNEWYKEKRIKKTS